MPKFAILNPFNQFNSLASLDFNQNLVSRIKENEIGPIIFDSVKIQNNYESRYFVFYDKDYAQNSTFELFTAEYPMTESSSSTKALQTSQFISLNPFSLMSIEENSEFLIQSKSTLNVINHMPLDFESIDQTPSLNSQTGVANKALKFIVKKFRK